MSATKLDTSGVFSSSSTEETILHLDKDSYRISKNGIEFQTSKPISDWAEMTIELDGPNGGSPIQCTGVVVGCHGTQSTGYSVSMVFMDLSPQSAAQIAQLA